MIHQCIFQDMKGCAISSPRAVPNKLLTITLVTMVTSIPKFIIVVFSCVFFRHRMGFVDGVGIDVRTLSIRHRALHALRKPQGSYGRYLVASIGTNRDLLRHSYVDDLYYVWDCVRYRGQLCLYFGDSCDDVLLSRKELCKSHVHRHEWHTGW